MDTLEVLFYLCMTLYLITKKSNIYWLGMNKLLYMQPKAMLDLQVKLDVY